MSSAEKTRDSSDETPSRNRNTDKTDQVDEKFDSALAGLKLRDESWARSSESPIFLGMDKRGADDSTRLASLNGQLSLPDIWEQMRNRSGKATTSPGGEAPAALFPEPGKAARTGERSSSEKQSEPAAASREVSSELKLSLEDKVKIGNLIWQNESGGKVDGLTDWTNKKEPFPSLGIGHMTWLQEGQESQFGDSFRPFIKKMEEQKNPHLPKWLSAETGNPWANSDAWQKDYNGPKMTELRDFLRNTIPEQTEHLISRLVDSRQKIIDATPEGQRQKVSERFGNLLKSPEGKFALIDYVNFKGEGLKDPSTGSGWGLRHVLQNMKDTGNPVQDFSDAAKLTLTERIKNRPQDASYQAGWNNRVERYKAPFAAETAVAQRPEEPSVQRPSVEEKNPKKPSRDSVEVAPAAKTLPPGSEKSPSRPQEPSLDEGEPNKKTQTAPKSEIQAQYKVRFELPKAVSEKSNPDDGEGYYQPLKASISELLGRKLSDPEVKAFVSGSKAIRAAAGKPLNELSTSDSVLPKDADEARVFLDNIGNRSYGRQRLPNNAIESLKKEVESKFNLRTEDREGPASPKPPNEKADPEKGVAEKAAAEKAAAEKAAAEKAAAEKAAAEKAAAEKAAAEKAAAEKAAAEKAAAEKIVGTELQKQNPGHDVFASLTPKEIEPPLPESHLKPGNNFAENLSIVKNASGVAGIALSRNIAASVSEKLKAPSGVTADTPVAVVAGMKPGTLGVLTHRGADGAEKQVAFIAGSLHGIKASPSEIVLNKAAAAELGIKDPRTAHSEQNGEATRTQPDSKRIQTPGEFASMDESKEKQWLQKAATASDAVDMQSYRRDANCGRGAVEVLRKMGYELPPGQEPATASDNRLVWTGARVAENLADQPGFLRVPLKDIPGGISALPNGTFIGRYHKESALQSRNFTMDRRFGEDPGDVDIKTKGHSPKPDGAYFRDSFAVLPSAHAEKLIGSVKAGSLKAEQEAAREARATEPDRGPSRPAITPRLDAINLAQAARSKDNESLLKEAPARVLELASRQDVLKEAEEGQEKSFPGDRAYIPRPDDKFGYRRTDRTDAELSDIKARMQKEAERNSIIAKGFDAGAADISDNISKAAKEAQSELEQIGKQQEQLSQILQSLKSGVSSANLDERLLKNLPADLARDLNLARFNRHAYDQNLAAVNNPEYNPFGMNTEKLQGNARQAVSYYKAQELRAVEKASSYLQFNEDRIKNQQRVINDAGRPQDDARKLLQLHFQSKSVAASILASNPDLLANKHAKGAMEGRRIAINSGHDPFHGSETPGFSGYDWSKTTENPKGMREYDFNRNTSAILGAMVEFTGGVPIYINQDELYKQGNVAAQRMSGLAEAMAASKADIYISHHMDDDPRFKAPGTLTLVGKDAHKLGALVNDGKGSLGVEPVRPVREQARGLQHFLPGNNVILDEMLTTFGSDRQKAMNPYEVGKLQLGVLVGMERFLNPRTASQMDREKQRDGKAPTWEAFWNKDDNRAKHGYKVIRYPEIYR